MALLLASLSWAGCFLADSADGVQGHGGGFDDDDGFDEEAPLYSGVFSRIDSSVDPATCGLSTAAFIAQFSEVEIHVYAYALDADFDGGAFESTYEISGTTLHDPTTPDAEDLDFADPAVARTDFGFAATYDCVLRASAVWGGEIVDQTYFILRDEYRFTGVSGAECELVATSSGFTALPCFDSQNTSWSL